jgi:ribonuclease P/MRP protein subunit POP1
MEKRRLKKKSEPDELEEMVLDDPETIQKLKPRIVTKGKFAHRQGIPSEEECLRAEDKTWLPTHLYHAKRARVEPRFGFSLPITPTEKSFRPTYRASNHSGFIAFDTSYFSTLMLHGTEYSLRKVLDMIIEPGSAASGKRYITGKRSCETLLYHYDQFPRGMIGPAMILWRPSEGGLKQVMIRIHPAIVTEVWDELHVCAKSIGGITIEDARFEIGAIDLFGPLATEVLFAVLKVGKGTCTKVWNQLRGLGDAASLPIGAVLDLDLCDPRIEYSPS